MINQIKTIAPIKLYEVIFETLTVAMGLYISIYAGGFNNGVMGGVLVGIIYGAIFLIKFYDDTLRVTPNDIKQSLQSVGMAIVIAAFVGQATSTVAIALLSMIGSITGYLVSIVIAIPITMLIKTLAKHNIKIGSIIWWIVVVIWWGSDYF